mmetsp:Transcript_63208/g.159422  ORF Transcript_63208/g.159422 Transcript_63208/m.159422 type:complete len:202 (-) Transcript_63208:299-904(-)
MASTLPLVGETMASRHKVVGMLLPVPTDASTRVRSAMLYQHHERSRFSPALLKPRRTSGKPCASKRTDGAPSMFSGTNVSASAEGTLTKNDVSSAISAIHARLRAGPSKPVKRKHLSVSQKRSLRPLIPNLSCGTTPIVSVTSLSVTSVDIACGPKLGAVSTFKIKPEPCANSNRAVRKPFGLRIKGWPAAVRNVASPVGR